MQCMTQLNAFYCTLLSRPFSLAQKSDLRLTERLADRADAEYSSVILYAILTLFIFCVSESTCPLTTVVNIGR